MPDSLAGRAPRAQEERQLLPRAMLSCVANEASESTMCSRVVGTTRFLLTGRLSILATSIAVAIGPQPFRAARQRKNPELSRMDRRGWRRGLVALRSGAYIGCHQRAAARRRIVELANDESVDDCRFGACDQPGPPGAISLFAGAFARMRAGSQRSHLRVGPSLQSTRAQLPSTALVQGAG